ncbi:hypothetical protein [Streptomyces tailanensis]|nr:hypothetical protein [Streptomyces tailanensis]
MSQSTPGQKALTRFKTLQTRPSALFLAVTTLLGGAALVAPQLC